MDNNTYPKIFKIKSWCVVIHTLLFFIAINVIVAYFFNGSIENELRFSSPASFQEMYTIINKIKHDKNKKVIFLGGSAMWGGRGIKEAKDSLPYQFKKFLKDDIEIYDLAYPAARPLDQLLLFSQIKDSADLIIADINTVFLGDYYNEGVIEDYSKYIRTKELLSAYTNDIIKQSPKTMQCLYDRNIKSTQDYLVDATAWLPLLHYKDQINRYLFGKQFSSLFANAINSVIDFLKFHKKIVWGSLLKPTVDVFDPQTNNQVSNEPIKKLQPTLNSCILGSFATLVDEMNAPVIFYISPHSTAITALQRKNPIYQENAQFVSRYIGKNILFNFDTEMTNLPPDVFVDEVHFNAKGHTELASMLAKKIKDLSEYTFLFK